MPKNKRPSKVNDKRPRFGWTDDLDKDPQFIYETQNITKDRHHVVVIPLPYSSPKQKAIVRAFAKSLWPKD